MLCITNSLIKHPSFIYTQLNVKTVLFRTIQLSMSTQFSSIWLIDKVIPPRVTVDLKAMAMKEYSAFPKAPAFVERHHVIV